MITALTLSAVLTVAQVRVLNLAYAAGEPYGLGKTLQAITLQESSAGADRKHRDKLSTGVSQIWLSTARLFDPQATRDKLRDTRYNLDLAAQFLAYCNRRAGKNQWHRAIYCYHYGLPRTAKATDSEVETDPYVQAIIKRYRFLESIKVSHD